MPNNIVGWLSLLTLLYAIIIHPKDNAVFVVGWTCDAWFSSIQLKTVRSRIVTPHPFGNMIASVEYRKGCDRLAATRFDNDNPEKERDFEHPLSSLDQQVLLPPIVASTATSLAATMALAWMAIVGGIVITTAAVPIIPTAWAASTSASTTVVADERQSIVEAQAVIDSASQRLALARKQVSQAQATVKAAQNSYTRASQDVTQAKLAFLSANDALTAAKASRSSTSKNTKRVASLQAKVVQAKAEQQAAAGVLQSKKAEYQDAVSNLKTTQGRQLAAEAAKSNADQRLAKATQAYQTNQAKQQQQQAREKKAREEQAVRDAKEQKKRNQAEKKRQVALKKQQEQMRKRDEQNRLKELEQSKKRNRAEKKKREEQRKLDEKAKLKELELSKKRNQAEKKRLVQKQETDRKANVQQLEASKKRNREAKKAELAQRARAEQEQKRLFKQ